MTNRDMEIKASKIFEVLQPSLRITDARKSAKYFTTYGSKTQEGVIATIFNILAEVKA